MFDDYYSGSLLLKSFSDLVGIQVDRINFAVSQLTALCAAFLMRRYLHWSTTSPSFRHAFSCVMGLFMSYFCFGNEVIHLLFVSTLCYFILKFQSPKTMQNSIFVVSMGYLSLIHLKRLIYNYGAYNLDITGPLMVMVQRVSGLAFSLHDGLACDADKLSAYRKKYATKVKPSVVEYYGYLFQFQSILAGPNILFQDYVQFADGTNFKKEKVKDAAGEPPVGLVVLKKVIVSALCIILYLYTSTYYTIEKARGDEFLYKWNFFHQIFFLHAVTTLTRFMYYHAWIIAEAVCNASGFGFNGFDESGNAKWDLASNVNILRYELSDNMRSAISFWNTGTNIWLRFLVYERLEKYEKYKVLCTFLLSAVWHGFYPGYYICFVTAAMCVSAARVARKTIRPYFLGNLYFKMVYDFISIVCTRLAFAYFTFPFLLFSFSSAFIVYWRTGFYIHIGSLFLMFVVPLVRRYFPKPPIPVVN